MAARERVALNAIRELRKYLRKNPSGPSAKVLAKLAVALANEQDFALADLYRLPYEEFELAIALLRDWRLDRYYAARIQLFDVAQNEVLPGDAST